VDAVKVISSRAVDASAWLLGQVCLCAPPLCDLRVLLAPQH
jgi:hypothetical protein